MGRLATMTAATAGGFDRYFRRLQSRVNKVIKTNDPSDRRYKLNTWMLRFNGNGSGSGASLEKIKQT